ncbi:MAG: hypothetical protein IPK15_24225 [Verrucomicrobia bacterium]|nr:hypothetical protein [Verrucomicrobiota bacterium]
MIHKVLRNNAQASGGFTDLFILGNQHKYDPVTKTWGSDFTGGADSGRTTTAATNTVYNLIQVSDSGGVPIYIVGFPLVMQITVKPFTAGADNPVIDIGVGNSLTAASNLIDQTAAATSTLETANQVFSAVAATVPLATNTASQWLTANLISASANVAALPVPATGTEIWIYACLLPYREWVTNRQP